MNATSKIKDLEIATSTNRNFNEINVVAICSNFACGRERGISCIIMWEERHNFFSTCSNLPQEAPWPPLSLTPDGGGMGLGTAS
jgi:hypothetical protein